MVAACDSHRGRPRGPARSSTPEVERPGVDSRDLLARPDMDAVIIATPADQHYAQVKAALSAGKHVFVEKPMARTVEEAKELMQLANERRP